VIDMQGDDLAMRFGNFEKRSNGLRGGGIANTVGWAHLFKGSFHRVRGRKVRKRQETTGKKPRGKEGQKLFDPQEDRLSEKLKSTKNEKEGTASGK